MQVTINGEVQDVPETLTVATLVVHLGADGRKVAIERNGAIVPKALHAETIITEKDEIEIVAFIGGG
jgi:thiamine biosynthesis protein ThiS